MSVTNAVSGLAKPSTFAPSKPKYIANIGEPQQPIKKQPLAIRIPASVTLPAAAPAVTSLPRLETQRLKAHVAKAEAKA